VIPVVGADEMLDLMIGLLWLPDFRSRRIAFVSGGGAITVALADELDPIGLSTPEFSDDTKRAIRALLPPSGNTVGNPLDTGPPLFFLPKAESILEVVAASDRIDAVIVQHEMNQSTPGFDENVARVIPSVRDSSRMPFVVTMPEQTTSSDEVGSEEDRRRYRESYLERGVPVFDSLHRAVGTLARIARYNEFRERRRH
jgi:acyl-CoA synthetase (NDP forming)